MARLPFLPSKLMSHTGAYGTSFTELGITQYPFLSVTVIESGMHTQTQLLTAGMSKWPVMILPLSSATTHGIRGFWLIIEWFTYTYTQDSRVSNSWN